MSQQPRRTFAIAEAAETDATNEVETHIPGTFLAVCAIFRNEAPYLDEWIRFHKAQGVAHFYLYNNFSDDNFEEILKPHQAYVTIIPWPISFTESGQHRAYADCISRNRRKHRWIAIIDIDEYLFGTNKPITQELQNYPDVDQVLVNCINYGTSGLGQVPQGGVAKCLTKRAPLWWIRNAQRKSIVNPSSVQGVRGPHEMVMDGSKRMVNGDGRHTAAWAGRKRGRIANRCIRTNRIISKWIRSHRLLVAVLPRTFMLLLDFYGEGSRFNDGVGVMRINHYIIRSGKEFYDKTNRYRSTQFAQKYNATFFKYHDQNQVNDPILSDWESGGMYR